MTTQTLPPPCTPDEDEVTSMRSSGAAQRALDYYLKETPVQPADGALFEVKADISDEDALVHASDLLRSAAATAYESATSNQGNARDLAFSVVYLIDMAKAMVERSLRLSAREAVHPTNV
ncbi:MAG: hypothetical protein GAK37_00558 [Pseudomonas sp.]|nr:MAG: hypothetical protein GAK37_00558 [Pseudomonas sp.]